MLYLSFNMIWAASSEFVSSSIPSWQILTAHAQPFRGARDLVFCLKVPLDSLLVWASSEGSGETARMGRLAWTFAARISDKYQIRLTRSIYDMIMFLHRKWLTIGHEHGWGHYKTLRSDVRRIIYCCVWQFLNRRLHIQQITELHWRQQHFKNLTATINQRT